MLACIDVKHACEMMSILKHVNLSQQIGFALRICSVHTWRMICIVLLVVMQLPADIPESQ